MADEQEIPFAPAKAKALHASAVSQHVAHRENERKLKQRRLIKENGKSERGNIPQLITASLTARERETGMGGICPFCLQSGKEAKKRIPRISLAFIGVVGNEFIQQRLNAANPYS